MSSSSKRNVLIFDFDGLILDTETPELRVWQKMFSEVGATFDQDAYLNIVGTNRDRNYYPEKALAAAVNHGRTEEQILNEANQAWMEVIERQPILPGVENLIRSSQENGVLLAVGSSSLHSWVEGHLTRLGLIDSFHTIVCSEDVARGKPSPDIFLKVLERLDVPSDHALVLEDSHNGVLAANRAEIRVVAVPNTVTKVQDFSGAEEVLSSLEMLDLRKYFPGV